MYPIKEAGITLITLVVIVIILLILAGVSINAVVGDGGFLRSVVDKQKEQRIEVYKTKIELITNNHITQKTLDDTVTEDDLFQDLIDGAVAPSRENITGSNGHYEVTTKEGDIFEIIIDEQGNVKVEYIGDKEGGIIKIGDVQVIGVTNQTISVQTNIRNPEGEYRYTYLYKKKTDKDYTTVKENETRNIFTYTGLESGVKYDIKVTVTHLKGITNMHASATTKSEIIPIIEIEKETVNTNSVSVIVKVTQAPEKMPATPTYYYYIKETNNENYNSEANYIGTQTTNTFTNLTQGVSYDIKVTTTDISGNEIEAILSNIVTETIGDATGDLTTGNIIAGTPKWNPAEHTATVELSTPTNLIIQWQKNNILENGWITSNTATQLQHGDTLFARLTDGINAGKEASVSIIDSIVPELATISNLPNTTTPKTTITATVTHIDNQSGINLGNCKWIFNTTSGEIGVDSILWNTASPFESLDSITIELPETGGIYFLHVLSADMAGNKRETVSNAIELKKILVADGSFNEEKGVNTPNLGEGMTPIKWTGSEWIETTADDKEWYDYSTTAKQWANAKTSDDSMWVWVPRYAYQISSGYHSTTAGTINIKFMKGIGQEAADGTTSWDNKSGQGNWNIHPGFEYDVTKPGIWVAKFEASHSDAAYSVVGTSTTFKILPAKKSWSNISVGDAYTKCLNYKRELNSHLIKNVEWGATVYLSQSEYGKNGRVAVNANKGKVTGASSGIGYASLTEQSTTGTVYGIYDMCGGAEEVVAAYAKTYTTVGTSFASLVNGASYTKDFYSGTGTASQVYEGNKAKYGDAVYEISTSYTGNTAWYTGKSQSIGGAVGYICSRGGYYDSGANASIFTFGNGNSRCISPCTCAIISKST